VVQVLYLVADLVVKVHCLENLASSDLEVHLFLMAFLYSALARMNHSMMPVKKVADFVSSFVVAFLEMN
jgi:hypothetical protein